MTVRSKIISLTVLWLGLAYSVIFATELLYTHKYELVERSQMEQRWARREKQIASGMRELLGFAGDVQGLAAQGLQQLELEPGASDPAGLPVAVERGAAAAAQAAQGDAAATAANQGEDAAGRGRRDDATLD